MKTVPSGHSIKVADAAVREIQSSTHLRDMVIISAVWSALSGKSLFYRHGKRIRLKLVCQFCKVCKIRFFACCTCGSKLTFQLSSIENEFLFFRPTLRNQSRTYQPVRSQTDSDAAVLPHPNAGRLPLHHHSAQEQHAKGSTVQSLRNY